MVEIVAEISGNHGGSLLMARELIRGAAIAGCDYAKFQFYRPLDMPDYEEHREMYEKLHVPSDWLTPLFETARDCGIGLFASVFSARAAREVLQYDTPFIKIASPASTGLCEEIYSDIESVIPRHVGLIVSSDSRHADKMWNWSFWGRPFKRMYCPPGHPQRLIDEDYNFGWHHSIEAFSDHSKGISAPLSMIREFPATLRMIEKHFKLEYDRFQYEHPCVDSAFSADPQTMWTLCKLAHNHR